MQMYLLIKRVVTSNSSQEGFLWKSEAYGAHIFVFLVLFQSEQKFNFQGKKSKIPLAVFLWSCKIFSLHPESHLLTSFQS